MTTPFRTHVVAFGLALAATLAMLAGMDALARPPLPESLFAQAQTAPAGHAADRAV